jgi:hypothetical protein
VSHTTMHVAPMDYGPAAGVTVKSGANDSPRTHFFLTIIAVSCINEGLVDNFLMRNVAPPLLLVGLCCGFAGCGPRSITMPIMPVDQWPVVPACQEPPVPLRTSTMLADKSSRYHVAGTANEVYVFDLEANQITVLRRDANGKVMRELAGPVPGQPAAAR